MKKKKRSKRTNGRNTSAYASIQTSIKDISKRISKETNTDELENQLDCIEERIGKLKRANAVEAEKLQHILDKVK